MGMNGDRLAAVSGQWAPAHQRLRSMGYLTTAALVARTAYELQRGLPPSMTTAIDLMLTVDEETLRDAVAASGVPHVFIASPADAPPQTEPPAGR